VAASLLGWFTPSRTIRIVEDENGDFTVQADQGTAETRLNFNRVRIVDGHVVDAKSAAQGMALAGSHVDLVLQPDRFIFRPLELPKRATEFMPGVVRSQIDRLTPWSVTDAAFGWSEPTEADTDKMVVTVAVTTVALIKPYVEAIVEIGARSVAVFTGLSDGSSTSPIKVWDQSRRGGKEVVQIRRALVAVLAAAGITTGMALGANAIIATSLTAQQDGLTRQISEARSAAGGADGSIPKSMAGAQRALEQRKHDAPSSVLVLEWLSKILPDQTYVIELRLEGNKVRLTGVTNDAPSLVKLIEQSERFARATFFAPTTRSPSETADRFHIEAIIKAVGPST
jgi:general secretion pathway protein L